MKYLLLWLATTLNILATPPHQESTHESFLGSNDLSYATIRTVHDNLGSYYSARVKTYLDVYNKSTRQLLKSTLLLDTIHHRDAAHDDPNTPIPISSQTKSRDKTIIWSHILEQFNVSHIPKDLKKHIPEITCKEQGIFFGLRLIIPNQNLTAKGIPTHSDEFPLTISKITPHRNSLYLELTTASDPDENGPHSYIYWIDQNITKQIHDWRTLQPTYLLYNTYPTLQQANTAAQKIIAQRQALKPFHPSPVIWKIENSNNSPLYALIDTTADPEKSKPLIPKLNQILDLDITLTDSQHLTHQFIPTLPQP